MQCKLTEPLGADVLVFELVVRGVGVDHNPLHAVAAELLLLFRQQSQDRQTSHREHARAEKSTGEPQDTAASFVISEGNEANYCLCNEKINELRV